MPDIQVVLWALPRIERACRAQRAPGGAVGVPRLSEHQVRILAHLHEQDPTMVTELADHMGVTPSTMSLNLKRLREAGLVTRERDPDDRRVMNVRLTPEGLHARTALSELDPDRIDAMLRRLGSEGRRQALLGLRLLAEAASAERGDGPGRSP